VATKKAVKPAKPVKKSPAKPAPAKAKVAKSAKPASKTVVKAAPKKAVPAKKSAPSKPVKPVPAAKKKQEKKPIPQPQKKSAAPKSVAKEPVKKPAVSAKTHPEVKPAIKPLEKQVKKEPAKPTKIVIPKTSTDKKIKYEPDFTKSVLDAKKNDPSAPSMRYSDQELGEFRELINKKLDTAKKELAYLQGLITRKDESGELDEGRYMTMEDGSMSMEREQLSQMASRQIQFIDHLEKAIMRIENKTYGICRVTGKLIDKARLRAVPHATLSIEAKQMMNK
jgi:RNA polymerase-binding transcription factor DksA